ncbi:DUF6850 family outer membrane beta-barrel protein [Gemmatimonas sp.]
MSTAWSSFVVLMAHVVVLHVMASNASAQPATESEGRDVPTWVNRWSPLGEIGSLTRRLPTSGTVTPVVMLPTPRIGMSWTGGNPAALAWDIDSSFAMMRAGVGGEDGALRRPLDAATVQESRADGGGWRRLGTRGAAVGFAAFNRTQADPSSIANISTPYASPRFVLTDTTATARRRTQARLHGAAGWHVGAWGVGVGLGYDTRTMPSEDAPFVRSVRAVLPAGTLGLARQLGARWRLGLHSTWQVGEETTNLTALGASGRVFPLQGYRNVGPQTVQDVPYFQRISRDGRRDALSASGRVAGWDVVAVAGAQRRNDKVATQRANDPPSDRWRSAGNDAGLSARKALAGGKAWLTVDANHKALRGLGTAFGAERPGWESAERRSEASADVRWRMADNRLHVVVGTRAVYETFELQDDIASLRSETTGLTNELGVDGRYAVSPRFDVFGGVAHTRYSGTGTIPDARFYGALYRRVFAPELDIATTGMSATALNAGVRFTTSRGIGVWLAARTEHLQGTQSGRDFFPRGNRSGRSALLGVDMR